MPEECYSKSHHQLLDIFQDRRRKTEKQKASCFLTKAFSVYWKSINFMADTKILGIFTTVCEKQLTALTHMLSFSYIQGPRFTPRTTEKDAAKAHSWALTWALTCPPVGAFLQVGKTTCCLERWENLLVRKRRRSSCMEDVKWWVREAWGQSVSGQHTLREGKQ